MYHRRRGAEAGEILLPHRDLDSLCHQYAVHLKVPPPAYADLPFPWRKFGRLFVWRWLVWATVFGGDRACPDDAATRMWVLGPGLDRFW